VIPPSDVLSRYSSPPPFKFQMIVTGICYILTPLHPWTASFSLVVFPTPPFDFLFFVVRVFPIFPCPVIHRQHPCFDGGSQPSPPYSRRAGFFLLFISVFLEKSQLFDPKEVTRPLGLLSGCIMRGSNSCQAHESFFFFLSSTLFPFPSPWSTP